MVMDQLEHVAEVQRLEMRIATVVVLTTQAARESAESAVVALVMRLFVKATTLLHFNMDILAVGNIRELVDTLRKLASNAHTVCTSARFAAAKIQVRTVSFEQVPDGLGRWRSKPAAERRPEDVCSTRLVC